MVDALTTLMPSFAWDDFSLLDNAWCDGGSCCVVGGEGGRKRAQEPDCAKPGDSKKARLHSYQQTRSANSGQQVVAVPTPANEAAVQSFASESKLSATGKPDFLHKISHLLEMVWEKERVPLGMRVCKWMQTELPLRVSGSVLAGKQRRGWGGTDPTAVSKSLVRLRDAPMDLAYDQSPGAVHSFVHGLSLAALSGFGRRLRKLAVCKSSFGDTGAANLALVLSSMPLDALEFLDLSSNAIGPNGMKALAPALGKLQKLSHLALPRNRIGDAGAESLAEGVKGCTTVTILNLDHNSIGDQGAGHLAGLLAASATLETLSLANNLISDAGGEQLAAALGAAARGPQGLTTLDLGCNNFTDSRTAARLFRAGTALQRLDLSSNSFVDGFERAFGGEREVLSVLGAGRHMAHLRLSGAGLQDEGAGALAAAIAQSWSGSLRRLELSANQIGDEGAVSLAGALVQCTQLVALDVSSNWYISDEGAGSLAAAAAAGGALEQLDVGGNSIRSAGLLLEGLKGCRQLRELVVGDNRFFRLASQVHAFAACLPQLPRLQLLGLSGARLGEERAPLLAEGVRGCVSLTQLDLSGAVLGDAGAAALLTAASSCRALRKLDLRRCGLEDGLGAASLAGLLAACTAVTALDLGRNALSNLRLWRHRLPEALGGARRLRVLSLRGCVDLSDSGAARLAAVLGGCWALEELDLAACGVGDAGAASLAAGAPHCPALAKLRLSANCITDDGAVAWAEALPACARLERLDLGENAVRDRGVDALTEALGKCAALRCLVLRNNPGSSAAALERFARASARLYIVNESLEEESEEEDEDEDMWHEDSEDEDDDETEDDDEGLEDEEGEGADVLDVLVGGEEEAVQGILELGAGLDAQAQKEEEEEEGGEAGADAAADWRVLAAEQAEDWQRQDVQGWALGQGWGYEEEESGGEEVGGSEGEREAEVVLISDDESDAEAVGEEPEEIVISDDEDEEVEEEPESLHDELW